jgi:hypothetical protein
VAANQPTAGEWVMITGGALTLVGSFLDGAGGGSAWSDGAFPIVTLIPIYAGAVAVMVLLSRFGSLRFPPRVMGFTWIQLYTVLGVLASVMALCWVAVGNDPELGLYLMLVGALGVVAGAVSSQRPGTSFRSIDGG